ILGFAALITAWDIGARRAAGLTSFVRGAFRETVWLPLTFIAIPLGVYIASWSGWFATSTGYDRDYAQAHGVHTPVISALYSLFEYHKEAVGFGLGLNTPHPYQSQPWDWLLVTRPVAFYAQCYTGPSNYQACPKGQVAWEQEVLALGTPAIWWGSMLALLFCLGWWLLHRSWRAASSPTRTGCATCGTGWAATAGSETLNPATPPASSLRQGSGLGEADAQAEAAQHPDEPQRGKERAGVRAADRHGGGEQQEHLDRLGGHQHGQAHRGDEEDAGPQPRRALEEPVQARVIGRRLAARDEF